MVKLTQPSELNSTDLADLSVLVYITILQIQKLWKICLVLRWETLLMLLLAEKIAASNWPTFTPQHTTKEKWIFNTRNGHRKTYSWEFISMHYWNFQQPMNCYCTRNSLYCCIFFVTFARSETYRQVPAVWLHAFQLCCTNSWTHSAFLLPYGEMDANPSQLLALQSSISSCFWHLIST